MTQEAHEKEECATKGVGEEKKPLDLLSAPLSAISEGLGMAGETVASFKSDTLWKIAGGVAATLGGLYLNAGYQQSVNNGEQLNELQNSTIRELSTISAKVEALSGLGVSITAIEVRLRTVEKLEEEYKGLVVGLNQRVDVHRKELDAIRARQDSDMAQLREMVQSMLRELYGIQRREDERGIPPQGRAPR